MPETMDPKHIETIDNIVSGYNKVKTLYKENSDMIRKLKAWFKEHRTTIIIVAIVLGVVGYYVYGQYQAIKEEPDPVVKKASNVKQKASSVKDNSAESAELIAEK